MRTAAELLDLSGRTAVVTGGAMGIGEAIADRFDSTIDHDDFIQAGNLYRMFDDAHRDRLAKRIASGLGKARMEIQMRQLCHFFRADEDYAKRVAKQLDIDVAMLRAVANADSPKHPPMLARTH